MYFFEWMPVSPIILFILITFLEGIILARSFKYDSFGRSLLVSLVMNGISAIIGLVLAKFLMNPSSAMRYYVLLGPLLGHFLSLLLLAFVLPVVIEGGILLLMRRNITAGRIWLMSLVANAVSYVLVAACFFFWLVAVNMAFALHPEG